MARARNYLRQNNPAAYYARYVAPNIGRPGMAGAAANVERQRLIQSVTNQAVNPGLDIRPSPGAAVVAMAPGNVPIYGQVQAAPAAPAPAPAPDYSAANAAVAQASEAAQEQIRTLTQQAQQYRQESEAALATARTRISELEDQESAAARAAAARLREQTIAAANRVRGQTAASLQIAPSGQTSQTAGTQAFRRRPNQFRMTPIRSATGINAPASNTTLNV